MSSIRCTLNSSVPSLLQAGIQSARLDAEVLLAHVLGRDRAWLIAHGDDELTVEDQRTFEKLITRRLEHEPVAYIIGHKEFYGRDFTVTPDVLIPRPESETIIDIVKSLHFPEHSYAIDVGTGSGCLGLTIKMEIPHIQDVVLCDISPKALVIAKRNNRERFHLAKIQYYQSDLLSFWLRGKTHITQPSVNLIVANLPYVDRSWETSPELRHEPELALYAEEQGLKLIKTLLSQAHGVLAHDGYLLLEADPCQHEEIRRHAALHGFTNVETRDYIVVLQRA